MSKKNNIRSIRFSDELAELIDRQVGDTFTQKFENFVTRCVWELPKKEQQIQMLDEMIAEKRQELYQLRLKTNTLSQDMSRLSKKIAELGAAIDQTANDLT